MKEGDDQVVFALLEKNPSIIFDSIDEVQTTLFSCMLDIRSKSGKTAVDVA